MDLVALADFNAVAAHGGFGPASRATGQPKASLSRHVRALEAELGVRLVDRGARKLRLTDEGAALHGRTAGLLGEIDAIGEELVGASGAPRGRLRVSIPATAATRGFGEMAARFVAENPEIVLEIVAEDRFVDPVADGYDIVLRANPAPDSALVGQRVRRDSYVVAAPPGLAVPTPRNTPVPVPAVVHGGTPLDEVWRIDGPRGPLALQPIPVLRLSSMAMLCGAARAGAGAGLFPRALVAADIAAGQLVEWGVAPGRGSELWALHASRRLVSAKVTRFLAALKAAYAPTGHDTD